MLRALPAAAMELPRRIGPGEAPGADLRQSCDFTNIEAGRSLLRLGLLLGLSRDPYALHVCNPQMVSRVCFPRRRFDVGPGLFRRQGGRAGSARGQLGRAQGDVLALAIRLHFVELAARGVLDVHDLAGAGPAAALELNFVTFFHCLRLIKVFVMSKVPADLESASGIDPDFGCRTLPLELR